MKMWLWKKYFQAKAGLQNFLREEDGEANIIAVILLILVVIAIVAIFKNQISAIITDLFTKIRTEMGI